MMTEQFATTTCNGHRVDVAFCFPWMKRVACAFDDWCIARWGNNWYRVGLLTRRVIPLRWRVDGGPWRVTTWKRYARLTSRLPQPRERMEGA